MSLLSAEAHAELTQLLQALQSANNVTRSQAEDHLQNNWTGNRPEMLLVGLAEHIQRSGDNSVRHAQWHIACRLTKQTTFRLDLLLPSFFDESLPKTARQIQTIL